MTPSEREGVFFMAPSPYNLYPAVKALYKFGPGAQPALLDYIVRGPTDNLIAWKNALYLLNSLQYGDTFKAFDALKQKRATLKDPILISHADAALQELNRIAPQHCQ